METKEFTAYLESKNLTVKTIATRIKYVEQFFAQTKKEDVQISKADVLDFLEFLKTKNLGNAYRRHYLDALNSYFVFLCEAGFIAKNPCLLLKIRGVKRKTLYRIYTTEELDNIFDNYYLLFVRNFTPNGTNMPQKWQKQWVLSKERNALLLSVLLNQGVKTGEVEKIEMDDLDLIKATIKIHGTKRSNCRTLPLKASQIGLFMNYLQNVRPQLLQYHTTEPKNLFFPIAKNNPKGATDRVLNNVFHALTNQLKTIDKQFLNLKQVRVSVITNWLKTEGLRKTQYLAGHRYTSSTENYLPNNLDNLVDDINKLHPFDL